MHGRISSRNEMPRLPQNMIILPKQNRTNKLDEHNPGGKMSLRKIGIALFASCSLFVSCVDDTVSTEPDPNHIDLEPVYGQWQKIIPVVPTITHYPTNIQFEINRDSTFTFVVHFVDSDTLITNSGYWNTTNGETLMLNGDRCYVLDETSGKMEPFTAIYDDYDHIPPVNLPIDIKSDGKWSITGSDLIPMINVLIPPDHQFANLIYNETLDFEKISDTHDTGNESSL
ncbi:hypothetical protein CHISP_2024 [Chitinispirillum alkaliphilum]|nr:hypothetical protein CHISP_2024 [Chitinispirillum alkaliphilum]